MRFLCCGVAFSVLVVPFASCSGQVKDEVAKPASGLNVKLGKVPALSLTARPPITEAKAKEIKGMIAGLAALDRPDFGLAATLGGNAFSPLPGQSRADTLLLTDHGLRSSDSLKQLVALGPDALPFLLDALDDQTPTKITVEHSGGFGIMCHASELHLNPVSPAEETVYKARKKSPKKDEEEKEHIDSYTVKVGDVCFVAIGQIVGRSYQAVRYQPTACIMLNSPVHDPKLCAEVRAIWKSKEPRRKLFDSLLTDCATEGVFNGRSLDGWDSGNELQCGAALRLLYYFPNEASGLVSRRLDELDVGKDPDLDSFMRRCVANGVRDYEFIKAVAWCKTPAVRAALARLFNRAEDMHSLLAALPAIEDTEMTRLRLEQLVAALPVDKVGPYDLLVAFAQRNPQLVQPVFERYLRNASSERCHAVCLVLREVQLSCDKDLLGPLLSDTRTWGWTYAVVPGSNEPREPIRVCDEAAVTLSANHTELKFAKEGKHADLDKQIEVMRRQLALLK
jgi:hypothetical protein